MALLPDVEDIPFLNPFYEDRVSVTPGISAGEGSISAGEGGMMTPVSPGTLTYDDYGGGSGDGMVSVIGAGGSGDYLDYGSIISAGEEAISAGEGGMIPVAGSNTSSTSESGGRKVKEVDPMDGWFPGQQEAERNREEFDRLGCRDFFFIAKPGRTGPMPKECERLLYSISFLTFQGAWDRPCNCDNTGSKSAMCDKYYGGCECKTLVMGRMCDTCAPAAFGFRSSGCQPCDCHHQVCTVFLEQSERFLRASKIARSKREFLH